MKKIRRIICFLNIIPPFLLIVILFKGLVSPAYAISTVIGPLSTTPAGLVGDILKISVEAAGGIAFLLMLYGGFLFMTSAGDPNKLQEATDIIMSAIAGLLMIVFSIFLLNLIGIQILQL